MVVFGGKSSSAKTKLFEQPLDKLFSPKAIKQLNEAILASSPRLPLSSSLSAPLSSTTLTWAKLSQDNSATKRRRTLARLRRFTIDANNNANLISSILSPTTAILSEQQHYSSLSPEIITYPQSAATTSIQKIAATTNQPQACGPKKLPNHLKNDEQFVESKPTYNAEHSSNQIDEEERSRLLLNVLPEPIKRLLSELYLRGPETVGIFRKSPNAKHCKDLRQKLETPDSQEDSIEQFQVTVIASVFKEWLRSLPDCLLMSRLYPQWIDVAKLIEPLHLNRQEQEQQSNRNMDPQLSQIVSSSICPPKSLNSSIVDDSPRLSQNCGELSRALSSSVMTCDSSEQTSGSPFDAESSFQMNSLGASHGHVGRYSRLRYTKAAVARPRMRSEDLSNQNSSDSSMCRPPMTDLELRERHNECIRILRQLLELLDEPNSILLKAIICVLWHIADNCEHNKMSSQNLGVCIGQSLLNDEHQSKKGHTSVSNIYSMRSNSNLSATSQSGGATSALRHFSSTTFAKRHRRARSQCLLTPTLSLTNLTHLSSSPPSNMSGGTLTTSPNNTSMINCSSYLDSTGPQEAAKYVPILVAFMIDNAKALFGYDIVNLFGKQKPLREHQISTSSTEQVDSSNRSPFESSPASCSTVKDIHSIPNTNKIDESDKLDTVKGDSTRQQSETSTATTAATINSRDCLNEKQRRPLTATERLCLNSPDLVVRASDNTTSDSTSEPFIKTHRRNLSTSVIVQIGNIAREISQTEAGTRSTPSDRLDAVQEMRASSTQLSEAGTTTSILIENTPKTTNRMVTNDNRQLRNQSSGSFTGSSDDDEVDSCRRQPSESKSSSPICDSQSHQQRPLSASESTGSSSRASSSTSGVHSESPAFSSETDTHNHSNCQTTTCSSSMSASISSPDPSSTNPSICTSPVDMVDGVDIRSDYRIDSETVMRHQLCDPVGETQLTENGSGISSAVGSISGKVKGPPVPLDRTSRRCRPGNGERPKSMASLNDEELLEFRTGAISLNLGHNLSTVQDDYDTKQQHQQQQLRSQDYVNCASGQEARKIGYADHRSSSLQSQTLNRYSSASSYHVTADRMPKIPFRYTTSCYGGEAVLYYPTCTHLAQQRQQQQQQQHQQQQRHHQHQHVFQTHRVCTRIHSLDRHSQTWNQQHQLPQRSHVMMLRDYYLSLQEKNQQRQQNLSGHHNGRSASMNLSRGQQLQKQQNPSSQQPVFVNGVYQHHLASSNGMARLQHQQRTEYGLQAGGAKSSYPQQQAHNPDMSSASASIYQRLQPRPATRSRAHQFNGLYVKRVSSPSRLAADVAALSAENGIRDSASLVVRPLGKSEVSGSTHCGRPASMMALSQSSLSQQSSKMSSTSSTENSADDESDDCSMGEWMESTMV